MENGVADSAAVTPSQDGTVNVRYDYIAKTQVIDSNGNVIKTQLNEAENMITFEGKAGVTYTISGFGKMSRNLLREAGQQTFQRQRDFLIQRQERHFLSLKTAILT